MNVTAEIHKAFDLPQEPLCAELAQCLITMPSGLVMIKHRLVNTMYVEPWNAMYNQQLQTRLQALQDAEAKGDWATAVFIVERPWRCEALFDYTDQMRPEAVGQLLPDVWQDTENFHENRWMWLTLFEDFAEHSKVLVESKKAIGNALRIFRGICREEAVNRQLGMSWTTDRDKAVWFANRFSKSGRVLMGDVKKKDIFGALNDRGESEIIVRPSGVKMLWEPA